MPLYCSCIITTTTTITLTTVTTTLSGKDYQTPDKCDLNQIIGDDLVLPFNFLPDSAKLQGELSSTLYNGGITHLNLKGKKLLRPAQELQNTKVYYKYCYKE